MYTFKDRYPAVIRVGLISEYDLYRQHKHNKHYLILKLISSTRSFNGVIYYFISIFLFIKVNTYLQYYNGHSVCTTTDLSTYGVYTSDKTTIYTYAHILV